MAQLFEEMPQNVSYTSIGIICKSATIYEWTNELNCDN